MWAYRYFIISGFLYGQKRIGSPSTWLRTRFVTISVPIYIYYAIGSAALLAIGQLGTVDPIGILKQLLHLQGIAGGGIGNLQTGHLWFITFIFICYLVTPFLERWRPSGKQFACVLGAVCVVEITIMLLFGTVGFCSWMPGVFSYVVAYYVAGHWDKKVTRPMILWLTVSMVAAVGLRLVARHFIDATRLYDLVVAPYTHCVLAFWIFFAVYACCASSVQERLFAVVRHLDSLSFDIYIVHYGLIAGVLSLQGLTGNMLVNTLALVTAIAVLSVGLKWVSVKALSARALCRNAKS